MRSSALSALESDLIIALQGRQTDAALAALPFDDFCARYLRIQDKRGDIVALQLNRAQRELHAALTGHDLVLKARQLGVSTVIQARLFYLQLRGNVRTNTLCHHHQLTGELRRMVQRFWADLPPGLQPERQYANATLTTYPDRHSEGSIATVGGTAGSRQGRGGSMTHIHGSEVAYWPDARAVMSAAMQAGDPQVVLESTANGMTGWFYDQCMAALTGDSPWALHFFPWWYDDGYRVPVEQGAPLIYTADERALAGKHGLDAEQINWRRRKRRALPHTFMQEYPEDEYGAFLASGRSFFGSTDHLFTAPLEVEPQSDRRYVAGLDFGQSVDYTVMIVIDATANQMVDMLRVNRMSWTDIRARIVSMAQRWGATVYAEYNSIGNVNIEELHKHGLALEIFNTTPLSKPPLIQGLHWGLHEGGLTLQDHPAHGAALRHELRAFVSKQTASGHWQYVGGDGAHDDTVIALALAWHGVKNSAGFILFET